MTFVTRFFHVEADSAQRIVFSLCAKSEQLRDVPIRRSLDVDAWFYSFLRASVEMSRQYPGTGVTRVPDAVRARFTLDTTVYAKYADAGGIPVLALAEVPDESSRVTS